MRNRRSARKARYRFSTGRSSGGASHASPFFPAVANLSPDLSSEARRAKEEASAEGEDTAGRPAAAEVAPPVEETARLIERADRLMARTPSLPAPPMPDPGPIIVRYARDVVAPRIYARLRPPPAAPRRGIAVLQLRISRAGELLDLRFLQRSPEAALNEAARRAVERAAPFPPPDVDLESILVNCRFDFRHWRGGS